MIADFISDEETIHCGFIPLVDCAILAIAKEFSFDKKHGINLKLHREVSWANIRDKVNLGHYECAQMLAGMPIAATLGIGHNPEAIIAPFSLGRGGNAITVSEELFSQMYEIDPVASVSGGMAPANVLKKIIQRRASAGESSLTLGMVYPFSCHNYDLRYWLAAAGINPDQDVRLVAIPPSLIAESLKTGHVQAFCVGEPWNSLAVEQGYGRIIATKSELWTHAPEKVLGVRKNWADENPEKLNRLLRVLSEAAQWLANKNNNEQASQILAKPEYLDVSQVLILKSLNGNLTLNNDGETKQYTKFIEFYDDNANFPWHSHAIWLISQMVRWGQLDNQTSLLDIAKTVFQPEIYRTALDGVLSDMPDNDMQPVFSAENMRYFDDQYFDPLKADEYIKPFPNV